jgi:hypothetical protein
MTYASAMKAVLRLDESVYPALMAEHRTIRCAMINVLTFGVVHALFSLYHSRAMTAGDGVVESLPAHLQVAFILIGAAVAFLMHMGGALFLWVFTRGIGGNTAFLPVYFNIGVSFIGLWPLAPALATVQAGIRSPAAWVFLFAASVYGLAVILIGAKSASGLSLARISIAMLAAIIFIFSFMYLWI